MIPGMYETFNSQSKNIGELLGGNERAQIVVPQFQRGYSWEKKHVEAFWSDIETFGRESRERDGPAKYFLGPIVVRAESKDVIYLLDGQQRLATTTILFSVIRDLARTLGIQDAADFARDVQVNFILKRDVGFALRLGEVDQPYFEAAVQTDPPLSKRASVRSHYNIQRSRTVLIKSVTGQIANLDPARALSVLRDLLQILRSDLVMACIPVTSERDAFRIFETLNDRGLRLSVPDLLLNYLMRQAGTDGERKEIRDHWNEMLEWIGRRDINRFLRHMWVSKYGDLKSKDLFSALKVRLEENEIGSVDFIRTCSEECEHYVQILDVSEKHLKKAAPYVRTLLKDLDAQASLPLLLSAYPGMAPKDFERVARYVVIFVVRYSVIAGLDSGGLENVFFALAREIRVQKGTGTSTNKCVTLIKDTLRKNAPSDDRIKLAMEELIVSPEEARYIISRMAARMQTSTKEVTIDEANIEHVFPKKPSKEWKDKEDLVPLLWHIGNLTMLGERLNSSVANKGYEKGKRMHYQRSELQMARDLATKYSVWNVEAIRDRARKLGGLACEIWNFGNPSRL